MNATKLVVLIFFIGFVCANVDAIRKIEGESKEAKLGISIPKTVIMNGFGTQLTVITDTYSSTSGTGYSNVVAGQDGPNAYTYGSGSGTTSGSVTADGSTSTATSNSDSSSQGSSNATAGQSGATANSSGSGDASSSTSGSSGQSP